MLKKQILLWLFASLGFALPLSAQYYFTGRTVNKNNEPLPFVKMRVQGSGLLQQSGSTGGFGITSGKKIDSVICYLQNYDTLRTVLISGTENILVMQPGKQVTPPPNTGNRLVSLTNNLKVDPTVNRLAIGESYSEVVENGFVETARFPTTGFSPNTNNASYSNIRRFINNQSQVPPDAVRVEEMLNYFGLSVAAPPSPGDVFNIETQITDCPWDSKHLLLFINAQAQTLNLENVPPANLVFLIDNSGSMDMPNRLPLLKSAFKMLVKNLRDTDRVAIVTYGGTASIALPPTSGKFKEKINKVIQEIMPGGATPGSNGIQLAYELATTNPIPHGNNRVILATDGDFNVGITAEKELEDLIEQYKSTGVFLTCLGVGMGNYKDSKIEVLAKHGNGNFAYLDKEQEAEKVLVKELTQNLYAIAFDASFQIDLNPGLIKQYRLIGYDNRAEAITDSSSKLLGGEIGSGYSMVSVFEIVPRDTSEAWRIRNLSGNAGSIRIRYKPAVGKSEMVEKGIPIPFNYTPFYETDRRLRFATAISMFGSMLRRSPFAEQMKYEQVSTIAAASLQNSDPLQIEFLEMVENARKIYFPEKKKKWSFKKDSD